MGTVQLNRLNLSGSPSTTTLRTITISGGTLDFQSASATISNTTTSNGSGRVNYTISSAISLGTDLALSLAGSGTTTLSGNISAGSAGPKTITTSGAGNATFSTGVISDNLGTVAITKGGSGTLTLAGNNTYTGATTVSEGVLSASSIVVSAGASNLGNATSAVCSAGHPRPAP